MSLTAALKMHFLNLYHIALSDVQIESAELEMLYKLGQDRGITKQEIDDILIHPDATKFTSPGTVLEKIEYLYDFALIAWADGKIDPNEQRLIELFCTRFGFQQENIPAITQLLLDEARKGASKDVFFQSLSKNL